MIDRALFSTIKFIQTAIFLNEGYEVQINVLIGIWLLKFSIKPKSACDASLEFVL